MLWQRFWHFVTKFRPTNPRQGTINTSESCLQQNLTNFSLAFIQMRAKITAKITKKSALRGLTLGLQRHFLLKKNVNIISGQEFSKSNQVYEAAIVELKRPGFGNVEHHNAIASKTEEFSCHTIPLFLILIQKDFNSLSGSTSCFTYNSSRKRKPSASYKAIVRHKDRRDRTKGCVPSHR